MCKIYILKILIVELLEFMLDLFVCNDFVRFLLFCICKKKYSYDVEELYG